MKEDPTPEVVSEQQENDLQVAKRKDTGESGTSSLSTMTPTENETDVNEEVMIELVERTVWADSLASPVADGFSPCVDSSLHGLGLKAALNRAQSLTLTGRKASSKLLEVAALYEPYAQELTRAAQSLQSVAGNTKLILSLQDAVMAWSRELAMLAATLKTTAQPMQAFLTTHGDAAKGVSNTYQLSRDKCREIRKRASLAKARYLRALEEADVVKSNKGDNDEKKTDGPDNEMSKRNSAKMQLLNEAETNYKNLVSLENERVAHAQFVETMGLEAMQLLEEDRVAVLVNSLVKAIQAEKQLLEEVVITVAHDVSDETEAGEAIFAGKKSRKKFPNLLKTTSKDVLQYEEGQGAMDASTLGLPEEVGKLRDQFRVKLMSKASRVQITRTLSSFIESVAASSAKLGLGLRQILNRDEADRVEAASDEFESPRIQQLWFTISGTLELQAQGSLSLASALRSARSSKLDKVVLNGDKPAKLAAEADDALWKQLCEAARNQSKAEIRYRQTTTQNAKVKERTKSSGSAGSDRSKKQSGGQELPGSAVQNHVNKSLANMFSILPDGGEQAMKLFAPTARASIAQKSLEEADSKEREGRQLLDAAVEAASTALEAYKSRTTALLEECEKEEKAGWEDMLEAAETFAAQVNSLHKTRAEALGELSFADKDDFTHVDSWVAKVNAMITEKAATKSVEPFMLTLELRSSSATDITNQPSGSSESNQKDSATKVSVASEEASTVSSPAEISVSPVGDDANDTLMQRSSSNQYPSPSRAPLSPRRLQQQLSQGLGCVSDVIEEDDMAHTITDVFLTYFWPDPVDRASVPPVVASFNCSYRDDSHRVPFQYGRLFVTSTRIIFISWTGRKMNLQWSEILDLESAANFSNTATDTVMLTTKKNNDEDTHTFLGGFAELDPVMEVIEELRTAAKLKAEEAAKAETQKLEAARSNEKATSVPAPIPTTRESVAPDAVLKNMEIVLSKHIRNVSIEQFYKVAWSEGDGTDEKALYGPWLEKKCFDVKVGDWEKTSSVGQWCKETYDRKRVVTFKVKRTTHLYIGPPVASVKQTHLCRIEGNDKCVLNMTVELDGIPYSDTFVVEVRWVGRREGNGVHVQVGVFVDFKKSTFLASKIRSGTIEETAPVHKSLFETIMMACSDGGGEPVDDVIAEEEESVVAVEAKPATSFFGSLLPKLSLPDMAGNKYVVVAFGASVVAFGLWRVLSRGSAHSNVDELSLRMDEMEQELKAIHLTMKQILAALQEKDRN